MPHGGSGARQLSVAREFLFDRAAGTNHDHTAAHRAARPHSTSRHLRGIDPEDGTTFRTRNVHCPPSKAVAVPNGGDASAAGLTGVSVRRSTEKTEPGNVLA